MAFKCEKIPAELITTIQRGRCVLFVGSGLSRGANLPDWQQLVSSMLDWCHSRHINLQGHVTGIKKAIRDGRLIDAAQTLHELMTPNEFYVFITDTFQKPGLKPTKAHDLLPSIPFNAVLTTNYDQLIEQAYEGEGKPGRPSVYTVDRTAELANLFNDESRNPPFFVLKVHGDVNNIGTVVLTHRDYRKALFDNDAFGNFFVALVMTRTLLFVGFSLSDLDVTLRFDELAQAFGGYGRTHYALMAESSMDSVRRYRLKRDYSIQIVPYKATEGHPEVTEFFECLYELTR